MAFCFRLLSFVGLALVAAAAHAQISGFSLAGENWTLTEGTWSIRGVLIKPKGEGPFPGMLLSHGRGGSAANMARDKGRDLAKLGYVCIAVDYTHGAGGSSDAKSFGASDENIKRALKCLEILRSLKYVDSKKIAAYGNSMGAFLTIGLAAHPDSKLRAAVITAGGITEAAGYAAPTAEVAAKIKVPFLIYHGEKDTTVPASRSAALKDVLDKNKVENVRKTYPEEGHNISRTKGAEIVKEMGDWLRRIMTSS